MHVHICTHTPTKNALTNVMSVTRHASCMSFTLMRDSICALDICISKKVLWKYLTKPCCSSFVKRNSPAYLGTHYNLFLNNQDYVYMLPAMTVTQYHKVGGLKIRNGLSHSTGSWKSETKVLAEPCSLCRFHGRVFPPPLLLGPQGLLGWWLHHSNQCLHLHMASFALCVLSSFSNKDACPWA